MSQVVRKQMTSGSTATIQIDSPTSTFLVKNFTSGVVYACEGEQYVEADSIMIAANTAEVVPVGQFRSQLTIHAVNSGTVEISRYDGKAIFSLSSMNTTQQSINTELQGVSTMVERMDSTLRNIDSTLTNLSGRLALSAGESPLSINPSDGGLDITISD